MKLYNIYNYVIICLGVVAISSCVNSAGDESVRSGHAEKSSVVEPPHGPLDFATHMSYSEVENYTPIDWTEFEIRIGILDPIHHIDVFG